MEDYLQHMKTLRSQMNDVEDQAAKISFEEQTQITTIQTLENDLNLAHADLKRLKEEADQMVLAKGQICSQILEKQRKIASLESDSSTLSQTLELVQQEGVSLSAKLVENRNYYATVMEGANRKFQEQQERMNSYKCRSTVAQDGVMNDKSGEKSGEAKGRLDSAAVLIDRSVDNGVMNLANKLESAVSQLAMVSRTKSNLVSEIGETKQSLEQVKSKISEFKPEIQAMNIKMLEEENQALLSDKAREIEYVQSLQQQFETIKGISHIIKCPCGEEYKMEVNDPGMR